MSLLLAFYTRTLAGKPCCQLPSIPSNAKTTTYVFALVPLVRIVTMLAAFSIVEFSLTEVSLMFHRIPNFRASDVVYNSRPSETSPAPPIHTYPPYLQAGITNFTGDVLDRPIRHGCSKPSLDRIQGCLRGSYKYSCTDRAREGSTSGDNTPVSIAPDLYIEQMIFDRVDNLTVNSEPIGTAFNSKSFRCQIPNSIQNDDDHRIRIRPMLPQRLPAT